MLYNVYIRIIGLTLSFFVSFPRPYQSRLVVRKETLDGREGLGSSAISSQRNALYPIPAAQIARENRQVASI